jgi:hypothetical protein
MKLPLTGPHSEETKRKISEANSGENNGQAKLNCEIAKNIREDYTMPISGMTKSEYYNEIWNKYVEEPRKE